MATITLGLTTDNHLDESNPSPSNPFGDTPGKRLPAYGDVSLPLAVTQFNTDSVDISVQLGDAVNGGAIGDGEQRDKNFDEFITAVSELTSDLYYCLGHWDLGGSGIGADDYAAFFADDGMGTVIPSGADAPATPWWPTAVADDSPVAYSITKNGFKLIFLAGILGAVALGTAGESDDEGDAAAITQLDWLEYRLDEAEAAHQPVIIFSHMPLRTTETLGRIGGYADGIALVERAGQTIAPVFISGHSHRDQSIIIKAGATHINIGGDVWGTSATDTTRYSHAVFEIYSPAVWNGTKMAANVKMTGYGHQTSKDYVIYGV